MVLLGDEPVIFDCKITTILRNVANFLAQVHYKPDVSLLRPSVSGITNCT